MRGDDLDFLTFETDGEARRLEIARPRRDTTDNSAQQVLWEMGLLLAGALSFALAVNLALAAFHIG